MTAGVSSMRFTSRDVKQLFPPEERTIIPVPLTDISTRNVILLRRFLTRSKNIVKLQLVMTSWQKFLRPLYVWLLHLSGFDKRFADTPESRAKKIMGKVILYLLCPSQIKPQTCVVLVLPILLSIF